MYGNYDGQAKPPSFDVYIGPNKWETVTLQDASFMAVKEIIHVVTSSYLDLCLVNTGSGTPFITAIETRLLKNTTYVTHEVGISLNGFATLDAASTTNRTVR